MQGPKSPYLFKPSEMGLESARHIEYLLTNQIGGYSSSTCAGLNSRKYHGVLVAARKNLERRVVVSSLLEEVVINKVLHHLAATDYKDITDDRGLDYLKEFTAGFDYCRFSYDSPSFHVEKYQQVVKGHNAVILTYNLKNRTDEEMRFDIRPLLACRNFHNVNEDSRIFEQKVFGGKILTSQCRGDNVMFHTQDMDAKVSGEWYHDIRYLKEEERGEASIEDLYCPGILSKTIPPKKTVMTQVLIVSEETEDKTATEFRKIRLSKPVNLDEKPELALQKASKTFVIEVGGQKTILAGYHWFMDWGRDTMISLPGLTLINGKYDVAESILKRFITHMKDGRIPTRFTVDGPIYYGYDGTLWMVDRVKEYIKYAGITRAVDFIKPLWPNIKTVVGSYSKIVSDGVLKNKSGTWMDTLRRDDAVEIQALWYNAVKTIEKIGILVDDPVEYKKITGDFESTFMDHYFNGQYLDDCLGDSSMRPNQAIAVSMEYSPIDEETASQILHVVADELLTPYGLRTLSPKDPSYCPRYTGSVSEREKAYHNGTIWPWLIGPYSSGVSKIGGDIGEKFADHILKKLFARVSENGLGTLAEIYDAEPPHTPRGCISQAWSVAEVLRAYKENTPRQKLL